MSLKVNSIEERVKLPPSDTISRCYQPQQGNRKLIRILTVVVYVLCVSLAAIMLSLYYIFIWDPTIRPFVTKTGQCEKIIIPEKIAIRLLNSSEVTAEQFYRHILEQYRILYQLQVQRQQFLQKQHIQLQQLAAGNRFQEIFATATIIQASANERIKKPITPTNGTFLLEGPIQQKQLQQHHHQYQQQSQQEINNEQHDQLIEQLPILDVHQTNTNNLHGKRKSHRKHNNNSNNSNNNHNISRNHTRRRNTHKNYNNNNNNNNKMLNQVALNNEKTVIYNNNNNNMNDNEDNTFLRPALNEPILLVEDNKTPATLIMSPPYTPLPIPLILSSDDEDTNNNNNNNNNISNKRRSYGERRVNMAVEGKRRNTTPTYMNPLLTGELIFEK